MHGGGGCDGLNLKEGKTRVRGPWLGQHRALRCLSQFRLLIGEEERRRCFWLHGRGIAYLSTVDFMPYISSGFGANASGPGSVTDVPSAHMAINEDPSWLFQHLMRVRSAHNAINEDPSWLSMHLMRVQSAHAAFNAACFGPDLALTWAAEVQSASPPRACLDRFKTRGVQR